MSGLNRDPLFVALTRPQMFGGVTYSYFLINGILAAESFLIFRSLWVIVLALVGRSIQYEIACVLGDIGRCAGDYAHEPATDFESC